MYKSKHTYTCYIIFKLTYIRTYNILILCPNSGLHSAVYHHQFRIQFVNQMEGLQPSLTISLTGTKEESGDIPISM